jgi:hypothetical protein
MPLSDWLNSTAALQRPTGGVDAGGAPTSTGFATVTGKGTLACAVWPVGSVAARVFGQMALVGDHALVFASDPGARAGDRLAVSGTYYKVNGSLPFANPRPGGTSVYVVDATVLLKS